MPFRALSLENTGNKTPEERNWRNLQLSLKSTTFTPTVTNGTNTVTPSYCVVNLFGPTAHVRYEFTVPVLAGFSTTTTINLPIEAYNLNNTVNLPTVFNVTIPASGAVLDTCYLSDKTTIKFAGGYVNNSGTTQTVSIEGWYFRN